MYNTTPPPSVGARIAGESASTELGWRIASLLSGYRFLVAAVLLITFAVLGERRLVGAHSAELFQIGAIFYLVIGMVSLLSARQRTPSLGLHTRWTLMVDILVVALLLHASGGVQSGLANLLILSVGASSLVLPARTSLMYAAIAALAILGEQAASQFEGITGADDFLRAGVIGAVVFLITILAQPVAQRLRESEALAQQRGVDLANLAELNNYIIQHLRESILVLDADDSIRLINGIASRHLGMSERMIGGHIGDIFPDLYEQARRWRTNSDENDVDRSFLAADGATRMTPHFAPIGDSMPPPLLVFLEDASQLAERVQQTKLAALGRLSASIAHEIRNPVGAISHAGQLLRESDNLGDEERRLTDIIHSHSGRINDIVKNVLQLSRRDQAQPEQLKLAAWLTTFLAEFEASAQRDNVKFALDAANPEIEVRMDPSHLHQVLWNLCENALRHAQSSDQPAANNNIVRVGRHGNSDRPFLEVLDRGAGIDESLRESIFEPFFTSAADGSGLGLFIARELCELNGATLVYEPRKNGGSCFRIIFADPQRWRMHAR